MIGHVDESNCESTATAKNAKKHRKRKKNLYKTIREQMEFYFSDSNLSKDKFMKDLIGRSEDGFVDLEVFATFNKIKSLTPDTSEVAQALWLSSDLLELNDDHTKVRRMTPVQPREDVDDCTIYVEHLPKNVDHAWLKRIFSSYGQVTYISLPRFKATGQPKGFAFVEFDTPTAAQRACEHLGNLSEECVRAMRATEPFEKPHVMKLVSDDESECDHKDSKSQYQSEVAEQAARLGHSEPTSEAALVPKKRKTSQETATPFKKRSRSDESDEEDKEHVKSRKTKEGVQAENTLDVADGQKINTDLCERKSTKKRPPSEDGDFTGSSFSKKGRTGSSDEERRPDSATRMTVQETSSILDDTDENTAGPRVDEAFQSSANQQKSEKKKRKRQKKSKAKMEQETLQLRVLSKCEWKRLKNRYLALQKASMSNLKRSLGSAVDHGLSAGRETFTGTSPRPKQLPDADVPSKKFEFQARVVVKMTMNSEIGNPKALIEKIKTVAGIDYVEAKLGQTEVFVRCHTPADAVHLLESDFAAKTQESTLLEGNEETQYWEKILTDREANRQKTTKVKVRGREKLLARADKAVEKSKHIYFDD